MANIFISHSSEDNQQTKEIFNSLKTISNSIFLDFDNSGYGLKGGNKWEKELYIRVKKARIMIVALSPHWLNSQWCYKEYCMARVLRKKIIPVIITADNRIASWDGNDIQHFDSTIDLHAIEQLKERISELIRHDITKIYDIKKIGAPFVGLRSFNKDEAGIFYGRNDDILDAIDKLNGMASSENQKFLNIIGASGVGKSSFLKAGILPLLELLHKDDWYLLPTFRAKQELLLNLSKTFSFANGSVEVLSQANTKDFFDTMEEQIYKECKSQNRKIEELKILFPIDQAEEILSSTDTQEREQFFKILQTLLEEKSNFFVVWTLRSDHLKKYQDEALLEFLHQEDETLLLKPIASKELKNIIQEPAYTADVHIEEAVVEEIKEDIRSSTSLPLLAHLLQTLYSKTKSKEKKQITLNDYKALSSEGRNPIENIINEQAEKIYKNIKEESLLQELFLNHLIKVNSDESVIKQSANLNAIPLKQQAIAEQFVAKRLFVKDGDGSEVATIEIAHEALISSWERLVNWIEAEKEFLLFRNHLELLYREWRESNEEERALLKDLNLEKALSFKSKLVRKEEIGFVELSFEYEEKQRKRRNFLRFGIGGVISSLGAFSAFKWFDAEEARAIASEKSIRLEKQKVLLQEEVEMAKHNVGLALLEKAKLALKDDDRARANLFAYGALEKISDTYDKTKAISEGKSIIYNYPSIQVSMIVDTKNSISSVAYSPDGLKIIVALDNGMIEIWDAKTYKKIITLKENVSFVAYSPSGTKIIGISINIINVWDAKTYKKIGILIGHTEIINSVAYSSDESRIISSSYDMSIKIWDAVNYQEIITLKGDNHFSNSASYSPDSSKIISASNTIMIWNAQSYKNIATLKGHIYDATSIAYSPDGLKIISGSRDGIIKIWDTKTYQEIITIQGHTEKIDFVDYSPDGSKIISGSWDKTIKIWDTQSYENLITLKDDMLSTFSVAYSPDGSKIISGSYNKTVKIWDIKSYQEIVTLKRDTSYITFVAYSPDGSKIISISRDMTINIWDAKSYQKIATLKGHTDMINAVAYSSDTLKIISASYDNTIKIWDIKNYQNIGTIQSEIGVIYSVAYSPDNSKIIAGAENGVIQIWNAKTYKKIISFKKDTTSINEIGYSLDYSKIISVSDDNIVRLWNAETYQEINKFEEGIYSSTFLKKSKIISNLTNGTIKIWDINTPQKIIKLKGNLNEIFSVSFSPDNSKVILGSRDGSIQIWDIKTCQEITRLKGHTDIVYSLAYSLDNSKIISGSRDGTIKIWTLKNFSMETIEKEKAQLEQRLQAKLDGIKLVPTKIPYTKPLWSKQHPNHWLLKLEESKNKDEKAKAMYELGLIYDRDNENQKALEWYKKSAQKGYKEAEERVVFLEGWMRDNL